MTIPELIHEMTLEEKASLCSGRGFWHTKAIERLDLPAIMVSDGPYGLRKQDIVNSPDQFNKSIDAVCYPTGSANGASFDKELIYSMGQALGQACQAENVSVLLGPAVNIKRSPLCGRNFEYFSEDPYLTTTIASSYIDGVQSQNVGTSIKHFLANNQEHRRMSSSSEVDERTLREIYLAAFEGAIKEAKPWTVMCSYNRINGVYASESQEFLNDVLRDEWGYEGIVVSDWGAVNDRVEGLKAGLELEMPDSQGINDQRIIDAVNSGDLEIEVLNESVSRILKLVDRSVKNKVSDMIWDKEAHHQLSKKISSECMVLLKNDDLLPLNKTQNIAFIGEFAKHPRYQGGGSSHISSFKSTSATDVTASMANISYAQGYRTEIDEIQQDLVAEAVDAASKAEVAVIFAGLPDLFESEGYDRTHMSLPKSHNHLIGEVLKVQPNTVVVLHNGSPVEMPWIHDVKAVLEVYLGGQAVGEATVEVLFGDVNPSGKLAETFPIKLSDNPSYLYYLGEKDQVEYREGVFVGYRYYDKKEMDVLFPFGHGLSYTSFAYENIQVSANDFTDEFSLTVTADITNTGSVAGKEVVQLYVAPENSTIIRPVRELKNYTKIYLTPGESKKVSFTLDKRALAYYNTTISDWYVEDGNYAIELGRSSRDLPLKASIAFKNSEALKEIYTLNTNFGDILDDPKAMTILKPFLAATNTFFGTPEEDDPSAMAITPEMQKAMLKYMPLRGVFSFTPSGLTHKDLDALLDQLNKS